MKCERVRVCLRRKRLKETGKESLHFALFNPWSVAVCLLCSFSSISLHSLFASHVCLSVISYWLVWNRRKDVWSVFFVFCLILFYHPSSFSCLTGLQCALLWWLDKSGNYSQCPNTHFFLLWRNFATQESVHFYPKMSPLALLTGIDPGSDKLTFSILL